MKKNTSALLIFLSLAVGCAHAPAPPSETSAVTTSSPAETTTAADDVTSSTSSMTVLSETTTASAVTSGPIVTTEVTTTCVPKPDPCVITSFTVSADKNRNLCESISGVISDNTITLTVNAPTDTFSLREAVVDIETNAISYLFSTGNGDTVDLTFPDCTVTVTDTSGNERTYSVILEYSASTIPVISVNTDTGEGITSKEEYVNAVISIDTAGVDGWYLPEGFESLEPTQVMIKGRGNSTWKWDKKPYKIKFNSKTSVLGLTEAKKWVLLANYADYSLMRNYVAYEASKVLSNELSPLSQYPVNLFVNGEYQGVYTIGEDHEVKNGRVELEKNNGTVDTSYMLEVGGYNNDEPAFDGVLILSCSIEYPEKDVLTQEQINYIAQYIKDADMAVMALDGYENYIDIDSLIDWFISNELFYNLESTFRRSCFITKEPGGLLTMGPLWDFDLAIGNLYNDFGLYESFACLTQEYEYIKDNWFCYLLNDETFRSRLRVRWDEVKQELLDTTVGLIDRMGETLSPNAEYNFRVWNTLGTRAVPPQPTLITGLETYEDNVQYIRDFIVNRWNWLDRNI